jgi:hypothetical protein
LDLPEHIYIYICGCGGSQGKTKDRESKNMFPALRSSLSTCSGIKKEGEIEIGRYPSGDDAYPCLCLVLYKKCQHVEIAQLAIYIKPFPPFKRNIFSQPSLDIISIVLLASLVSIYPHSGDKWLVPRTFITVRQSLTKGLMKRMISEINLHV